MCWATLLLYHQEMYTLDMSSYRTGSTALLSGRKFMSGQTFKVHLRICIETHIWGRMSQPVQDTIQRPLILFSLLSTVQSVPGERPLAPVPTRTATKSQRPL
jgi:hypothetical protein